MLEFIVFVSCIVFFHVSEFLLALRYMPQQCSARSWLISRPYLGAMAIGCTEYFLERWLVPGLKQPIISYLGLALVALGEVIRKTAMVTAATNFTHEIRHSREEEHQLVTHGIYRYIRHPGYLGWLIWAVATQLLLVNPLSTMLFAVLSWRFFRSRIAYEEWTLKRFFGQEYVSYAERTPTWIPFIP